MVKYSMLRERIARDGTCGPGELSTPRAVTDEEILRAHAPDYLKRVVSGTLTDKEVRRIGFPWSEKMVERSRRASGGTLGACLAALDEGFAANLAGGTHHAFAGRGEGYCVFNDSAIAARAVQAAGLVERVVVIDTDVHQGNGTAAILHRDPTVFTFSVHGAKNFPFNKEESDLDAPFPTEPATLSSWRRSKVVWRRRWTPRMQTSPSTSQAPILSKEIDSAGSP